MEAEDSLTNCSDGKLGQATVALSIVMGSVAIVFSLAVVAGVFALRLHGKVVYRIALYQTLCAMAYAVSLIVQDARSDRTTDDRMCKALGFFVLYLEWTKLLLTLWSTYHLFLYSVCYRDMQRCEIVYAGTTLLVPLFVALLPLVTDAYGRSGAGTWCWIRNVVPGNCTLVDVKGVTEQIALWYGPALLLLALEFCFITAMAVRLFLTFCAKRNSTVLNKKYRTALAQMLPLLVYPVAFWVLLIPPFAYRLYLALGIKAPFGLLVLTYLCFPGWSLTATSALLIHIMVVGRLRSRRRSGSYQPIS